MADSTQNSPLSIVSWNCNGIFAHKNELLNHISQIQKPYDIICIQETKLKPKRTLTIPGYNILRRDRPDRAGGGLITLVKIGIPYTGLTKVLSSKPSQLKSRVIWATFPLQTFTSHQRIQ